MKTKGSNKFDESNIKSKVVLVLIMLFAFLIIIIYKRAVHTPKSELKN